MTIPEQAVELLPCPFCAAPAEIIVGRVAEDAEEARAICTACGAAGPADEETYANRAAAVSYWNKRPLVGVERAALPGREEIALARKFIAWWDTLPGGNNYSPQQVERWLNDPIIKELVSEQRATLSLPAGQERRVPEGIAQLHAYILHNYGLAGKEGGSRAANFERDLARQIAALSSSPAPAEEGCKAFLENTKVAEVDGETFIGATVHPNGMFSAKVQPQYASLAKEWERRRLLLLADESQLETRP